MTQETTVVPEAIGSEFGTWDATQAKNVFKKLLVFGEAGTGKTSLAATFPKPLFLDLEGGMASIRKYKPLRWPADPNTVATSFTHIFQFYKLVKKELAKPEPRFETIVIDSLNELQDIIIDHVIEDFAGVGKRLYDDQPTQSDYGKALRDFTKVFKLFLKLPCNVVFLATAKQKQYEDDKAVPDLVGKKTTPTVDRLVSGIGYTYTSLTNDGGKDVTQYWVSFEDSPEHAGKDRYGLPPGPKRNDYASIFGNQAKGTP